MYATLVGLITILAGVFLFTFVTSCGLGGTPRIVLDDTRRECLRNDADRFYDYRPYGLALIVLGLLFLYGVYRNASQQAQSE